MFVWRILVGISSWADRGLVESGYYPAGVKTLAERLRYYKREFLLAEIDPTYDRFTTRKLIDLWLQNTPPGMVRFRGRNRETWEGRGTGPDERYRYLYDEREPEEWLPKVRRLAGEAAVLHVIFKNKHADYPVRNARRFREKIGGISSPLPGGDKGEGESLSS